MHFTPSLSHLLSCWLFVIYSQGQMRKTEFLNNTTNIKNGENNMKRNI